MKALIFAALLLAPAFSHSIDYQIDLGSNRIDYGWNNTETDSARFIDRMTGIGVTAYHNSGFGFRLGYMDGGTEQKTKGRYNTYTVDFSYIASFELLYRKKLSDNINLIAGIGHYEIPVPLKSEAEGYFKDDRDDDEGYFYGFNIRLYNNVFLNYRYTKYSTIKSGVMNEWVKGNSFQIAWEL